MVDNNRCVYKVGQMKIMRARRCRDFAFCKVALKDFVEKKLCAIKFFVVFCTSSSFS